MITLNRAEFFFHLTGWAHSSPNLGRTKEDTMISASDFCKGFV